MIVVDSDFALMRKHRTSLVRFVDLSCPSQEPRGISFSNSGIAAEVAAEQVVEYDANLLFDTDTLSQLAIQTLRHLHCQQVWPSLLTLLKKYVAPSFIITLWFTQRLANRALSFFRIGQGHDVQLDSYAWNGVSVSVVSIQTQLFLHENIPFTHDLEAYRIYVWETKVKKRQVKTTAILMLQVKKDLKTESLKCCQPSLGLQASSFQRGLQVNIQLATMIEMSNRLMLIISIIK